MISGRKICSHLDSFGLKQRDRKDSQIMNSDSFYRLPAFGAQCISRRKNYPDAGIILNCVNDEYSQAYSQLKEVFEALSEMISLNHLYLIMVSDQQTVMLPGRMTKLLVKIFMFSIYVIKLNSQLPNTPK